MCLQVAPLDRHSGVLRELAHGWAALPGSAAFLLEMIGRISTRAQIERRGAFGGLYGSNVGRSWIKVTIVRAVRLGMARQRWPGGFNRRASDDGSHRKRVGPLAPQSRVGRG